MFIVEGSVYAFDIDVPMNSAEFQVRCVGVGSSVVMGRAARAIGFSSHTSVCFLHSVKKVGLYLNSSKIIRFVLERIDPCVPVLHRNVQLSEHSPRMIDLFFRGDVHLIDGSHSLLE